MAENTNSDATTPAASAVAKDELGALASAAAAASAAATTASADTPVIQPLTSAPLASAPKPAPETLDRRVYQAGGVRKFLLSLIFLLLLPFFISLPAMLYQRLTHQLWTDTVGFAIFAGAFTIIMLLVVFELIHSLRSRVEINDTALKFTLPATRGARIPKLSYRRHEIPFSDIDSIELRREIYGGSVAPVLLRGARIITKDGQKIPLGYVSEANVDPTLPLPEIASEVARRCGIEVTDRGNVRRELRRKLRGVQALTSVPEGIPESEVERLNRRHHNIVLALCAGLFLLVATGIAIDVMKANLDMGERASEIVQQTAKPSSQAQKK